MSRRYDLLVLDLDGTLLDPAGGVTATSRDAVARARDAGMEVIVATGRSLRESERALEAIDHDGLLVAASGSLLVDVGRGETVRHRALADELVHEVTDHLLEEGHRVLLLKDGVTHGLDYVAVGEHAFDPASRWWFEQLRVRVHEVGSVHEDPHPEGTLRLGAVSDAARLRGPAEALHAAHGHRCLVQHWSAVTESASTGASTHLLEVFDHGVNKWTMIETILAERGLDASRVAAVGDGLNDVELVREAGLGVAMDRCDERVAAVADRRTAGNDRDGVARAIEAILAGEW